MKKVRLELNHACAGQQKAGVVGNQRRGRHALAALLLEEAQVLLADFRGSHVLHLAGLTLVFVSAHPRLFLNSEIIPKTRRAR